MSVKVSKDLLIEAIAKKLHGIDGVPLAEREQMISRAAKIAIDFTQQENARLKGALRAAWLNIKRGWYTSALLNIEEALRDGGDDHEDT